MTKMGALTACQPSARASTLQAHPRSHFRETSGLGHSRRPHLQGHLGADLPARLGGLCRAAALLAGRGPDPGLELGGILLRARDVLHVLGHGQPHL